MLAMVLFLVVVVYCADVFRCYLHRFAVDCVGFVLCDLDSLRCVAAVFWFLVADLFAVFSSGCFEYGWLWVVGCRFAGVVVVVCGFVVVVCLTLFCGWVLC